MLRIGERDIRTVRLVPETGIAVGMEQLDFFARLLQRGGTAPVWTSA